MRSGLSAQSVGSPKFLVHVISAPVFAFPQCATSQRNTEPRARNCLQSVHPVRGCRAAIANKRAVLRNGINGHRLMRGRVSDSGSTTIFQRGSGLPAGI